MACVQLPSVLTMFCRHKRENLCNLRNFHCVNIRTEIYFCIICYFYLLQNLCSDRQAPQIDFLFAAVKYFFVGPCSISDIESETNMKAAESQKSPLKT